MIKHLIEQHKIAVDNFFEDHTDDLDHLATVCAEALEAGNKILLCGNGGSATDAMHIAGEFVGRFLKDRRSLPALSLAADSCALTAISNDYGYEHVFARQVEGLGQAGDVFIGISTSGNSANVIEAIKVAKGQGIYTVALTGRAGGKVAGLADLDLNVRHEETARIQEVHIMSLHTLCALVEGKMGLIA